jgi:hypothetical protein
MLLSSVSPVASKTQKFESLTKKIAYLLNVHLYDVQLWRHYLQTDCTADDNEWRTGKEGLHEIL